MSINLGKTPNILRSKKTSDMKISQYFLCKIMFLLFFSNLKDIARAQNKMGHLISPDLMIICLKIISEECFSFSGNVNANLTQPAITCSKLTIETLEQSVKYPQS